MDENTDRNDNNDVLPPPTNGLVTPLLTDLYQITMTYAHWKNNRHNDPAVFELFFRKNPFGGEYTIFAGLDEVLKFLTHYKFTEDEIHFLKHNVPALQHCDAEFFDWLLQLDTSNVKIRALQDGTVAFPRVPLLIVEAPLGIGQLIETTMLTLVNYPSLVATNAARMVVAVSAIQRPDIPTEMGIRRISSAPDNLKNTIVNDPDNVVRNHQLHILHTLPKQCTVKPVCVEFGLRRAQGPDGGFSASKYSALGGFVATSNVQAGKYLKLPLSGTHAHAFVQAYSSLSEVSNNSILHKETKEPTVLLPIVLKYRTIMEQDQKDPNYSTTNEGELAAFIAYATAFPESFLCLIDTYETLTSGLLNFVIVALALHELGYKPVGIRLDSGDLAYLSMQCARTFNTIATTPTDTDRLFFHDLAIVASNDINEDVLHALNKQEHAITVFGIGTNLVTCQAQPALGCVYKLVEISGKPRMKLSQEISKVLIPSKKKSYRLIGKDGRPILDLLLAEQEDAPVAGQRIMCRHPFVSRKRAVVIPTSVERLDYIVFEHGQYVSNSNRTLQEAKTNVERELNIIRPDILRYMNPTPYKVSVSETLFDLLHELWQTETPVPELS